VMWNQLVGGGAAWVAIETTSLMNAAVPLR